MTAMQDYLKLAAAGDWAAATEFYADDVVAHQAGGSHMSGTYEGKEVVLKWVGEFTTSFDSFKIEPHALTEGDGHAVLLSSITATKGDNSYSGNRIVIYHVDDGKITALWASDVDQAAMDAFLG